ncbi:MAG: DegT/DnrJ/EryC1/StrS family aminotransferase, partial [Pseudanabaena sp.]
HGITRDSNLMQGESHGAWYYQQLELGFNYRITDIQAALGASQMQRLDEFVNRRRFLAQRYNHLLQDLPITLPHQYSDTESSWHLYVIRLHLDKISKSHRQVFE